jgi:hypothetical protein
MGLIWHSGHEYLKVIDTWIEKVRNLCYLLDTS